MTNTKTRWLTVVLMGALVGTIRAEAVAAQSGRVDVTTRVGGFRFDDAASLDNAPFLGLDAFYGISDYFSLGTEMNVSRADTKAEDFITALSFGVPSDGDTTLFLYTGQTVNLLQASLMGVLRAPTGRFVPFALAGAGFYGMFLDPQINRGQRRFSGFSGTLGGGILVQLSENAGIQLDIRDVIFTSYDRAALDPADNRSPNIIFPEDFPLPPEGKSTVHNFALSLGFRYTPRGGADLTPATDPDDIRGTER
jgi:hypothetical protein